MHLQAGVPPAGVGPAIQLCTNRKRRLTEDMVPLRTSTQ